jgi:hypothetical protein
VDGLGGRRSQRFFSLIGGGTGGGLPAIKDVRGQLPTRTGTSYDLRDVSRVTGVDVHYTAGGTNATVLDIARFHTGPNAQEKFPAIAYHYVIDGSGTPHWCHDLQTRVWGSGAPGHNSGRVHVCYTGLVEPTAAQLKGIRAAIVHAQDQMGRPLTIEGHKDAYATSCPGPKWPQWKAAILP